MTLPKSNKARSTRETRFRAFSPATLAVVNAIMLAGAAHAQTNSAPAGTNSSVKLPDVVVKGKQEKDSYKVDAVASPKFTEPLRDIPQTITVIPKAVMQQQNATTLRDVLRNVPGITFQAGEGGSPPGDALSIRGFSARNDIFIDGVRDSGIYVRDAFNTEQVEVAKGPASSIAGRGTTGGAVNLISKTPTLGEIYEGTLGFGTDEYKRATVDFNQPLDKIGAEGVAVRLNGMWTDAGVAGRDEVFNKKWGVAPAVTIGLGTPTRFTVAFQHEEQHNLPDYGLPAAVLTNFANVEWSNFYGLTQRDREDIDNNVITGILDHDFNDDIKLRNLTRYEKTERDAIVTPPRLFTTPLNLVNPMVRYNDTKFQERSDDIFANQTDLNLKFETGPVEHAVDLGLEVAVESSTSYGKTEVGATNLASLYHPTPDASYTGRSFRNGTSNDGEGKTIAPYFFDTLKFGEKWQLTGGARFDHFESDFKSVGTNGVVYTNRTDDLLSGRVALVFKPVENGTLYAGFGTSFNPSSDAGNGPLTLGVTTNAVNPSLPPEENHSYEIGTKWDFLEGRLSLEAAVFRTEKINARTRNLTTDAFVLGGNQTVDGFELGAHGNITENWSVFGGYTYMKGQIDESKLLSEIDHELPFIPEHSVSLWTAYNFPKGVTIAGGPQYSSGYGYSTSLASTNGLGQAFEDKTGYLLFNAMAAYKVNEHVSIQLNVYNLTDEQYIDRGYQAHFTPGLGRSAILSANFKF